MKIIHWATFGESEISAALRACQGVELQVVHKAAELAEALPGAEVLMLADPAFGRMAAEAVRTHGTQLRWVHTLTAGYNNVQAHGLPAGVVLTNGGDAWSPAVAEHAMAMLLSLTRQLPRMISQQQRHAWDRSVAGRIRSLDGQVMAIVGFGSIGREVAKLARPFGMRIVGLTRRGGADPRADEMLPIAALGTVLPRADVVLLAVPYMAATHHLIDAAALAVCKDNAIIINVARGGVIDSVALAAALRSGRLGGAGLDVTDPEPLPAEDALWDCPNLIITPHVAGTSGAYHRQAATAAANLRKFLAGEDLAHRVVV